MTAACDPVRNAPSTPVPDPIYVPPPTPTPTPAADTPNVIDVPVIDVDPDPVIEPIDVSSLPIHKSTYKVSILLPFSPDFNKLLRYVGTDQKGEYLGLVGTEYYEGIKMAIDTLRSMGLNLDVQVFDTKKDPAHVSSLINQGKISGSDLIIGPVFNRCLRPMSDFAQQNKIPLISPFSSSNTIAPNGNSHLYFGSPTPSTEYEAVFKYFDSTQQGANFIVLKRQGETGFQASAHIRSAFDKLMLAQKGHALFEVNLYDDSKVSEIETSFSSSRPNIVLVNSNKFSFANQVLTLLQQVAGNPPTILFGPEAWLNQEQISLKILERYKFHCSDPYFIDKTTHKSKWFVRAFINRFRYDPSRYVYKGFDHMLFFVGMLKEYGVGDYNNFTEVFSKQSNLHTPIEIKASKGYDFDGEMVRFYENRAVNVVRLIEGKLEKVN